MSVGVQSVIPEHLIPKELITGDLRSADGSIRCRLVYKESLNHGSYGYIQKVLRNSVVCACKRPMNTQDSFVSEAIVQILAYNTLVAKGIHAVPRVIDIYRYINETRFNMEYIQGRSALEEINEAADPDTVLLQILAQLCLFLSILESEINLDHRDLKMTNLWIRAQPVQYKVPIDGKLWTISAPFQVVILDFGFACIGNGNGKSIMNLGNVIPDMDPCPKDGRDLYQCIMSLWSVEAVRMRLSVSMRERLAIWTQGTRIAETGSLHWIYLVTSHPTFRLKSLRPLDLLISLSRFGGHIALYES